MLRCLKCGGLLENKLRKYHPDCWKEVEHELGTNRNRNKRIWWKLSTREKRTLVFILNTFTKEPTQNQLKDICCYYGVDFMKIKDNMFLLDYIEKYENNGFYRKGTYDVTIT